MLRLEKPFAINNPHRYPSGTLDYLRDLLTRGVSAQEDPTRKGFYDIEADDRVFFVYVPRHNSVTLLAMSAAHPVTLSAA